MSAIWKAIASATGSAKPVVDPTAWWATHGAQQTVKDCLKSLPGLKSERKGDVVRFVCVSDTHNMMALIPYLPPGDVLLHAGDFSDIGRAADYALFRKFMSSDAVQKRYKHRIVIAGNHDLSLDPTSWPQNFERFGGAAAYGKYFTAADALKELTADANFTYLSDTSVTVAGYKIFGSPYQPWFHDWAFNLPRGPACDAKWAQIPADTDVLLTHGPPVGHGDLCASGHRAGCVDLLRHVQTRVKPKVHVFGHIHEGYGASTDGATTYINASTCNLAYDPHELNAPIIFDLPVRAAPAPASAPASAATAAAASAAAAPAAGAAAAGAGAGASAAAKK